ncbi:MAG TPA: fatty acid--CoA ligase, partial [Anaerolineales bacterium]|nr:fatty acid--CoA ligase [Anaerolineales bacterium]
MFAYEYPLLLKNVLESGVRFVPNQEIVYRDQVKYTYAEMYQRVLRLGAALKDIGVKKG